MNSKKFQLCSLCRNHDVQTPKRGHSCQFRKCECILCNLTKRTQKAMMYQQRFWRFQKIKQTFYPTENPSSSTPELADPGNQGTDNKAKHLHLCDKCRNHNIIIPKKNHVCPNLHCTCKICAITVKRRELMKAQQRIRRSNLITPTSQDDSSSSNDNKEKEDEIEDFYKSRILKDNDSLKDTIDFLQEIEFLNKESPPSEANIPELCPLPSSSFSRTSSSPPPLIPLASGASPTSFLFEDSRGSDVAAIGSSESYDWL